MSMLVLLIVAYFRQLRGYRLQLFSYRRVIYKVDGATLRCSWQL